MLKSLQRCVKMKSPCDAIHQSWRSPNQVRLSRLTQFIYPKVFAQTGSCIGGGCIFRARVANAWSFSRMKFTELGLVPEILRAIADQGYETPTPIQAQAIPVVLAGHDLMACAQTGTGKTAGFTLPILNRLAATPINGKQKIRVLILTPTRELAAQV